MDQEILIQSVFFCFVLLAFSNSTHGSSGVARIPCALGQDIFLRPLSIKTTEFEVKNRCKSAEEAKPEQIFQLFYSF